MSTYQAHEEPPTDEHLVGASVDFNMNGVSFAVQEKTEQGDYEPVVSMTIPWEAIGFKAEQGTHIGTALHTTETVEAQKVDKGDVTPEDNPFDALISGLRSAYDAESVFWMLDDAYDRLDDELASKVGDEPNVGEWVVVESSHSDPFLGQVTDTRVDEVKVSPDKDATMATWAPTDNVTAFQSYGAARYEVDDISVFVEQAIEDTADEIIEDEDVASVVEDVIELTSGRATEDEVRPVVEEYFDG